MEGAEASNDAIKLAIFALLDEILSVLCLWFYELSELTEGLPVFVCTELESENAIQKVSTSYVLLNWAEKQNLSVGHLEVKDVL